MEDMKLDHSLGYSTEEALIKLRNDIKVVLDEYSDRHIKIKDIFNSMVFCSSEKILLSGVAYTITIINIVLIILIYLSGTSLDNEASLLWEAFILFLLLILNIVVGFHEQYLYVSEISRRANKVINIIDESIKNKCVWKEAHYPHLCTPFSPCVVLQWTYRDGKIVNLPWALLVEGDVIILRPGQEVPGYCQGLKCEDPELYFRQTFLPAMQENESFNSPRIRTPYPNKAYKMLETPYLKSLKVALEEATKRPVTVFEKQRHLCTVKIMQNILLPSTICLVLITNVVRDMYNTPSNLSWTDKYILQTIAATFPLLQLFFPFAWVVLNCYGLTRFKLLSDTPLKCTRPKSCSLSEEISDPLIQALSESSLKVDKMESFAKTFFNILFGKEDMITRTSNIVHVLGSLSALCCVDKKGILSWPDPTAEKVFFLRESGSNSDCSSKTSLDASMGPQSQTNLHQTDERPQTEARTVIEVLDLTHEQSAPFHVEFAEAAWRRHAARLRPLGLAALLNTCAQRPRHAYAQLCAHISCEAQLSEDLVPVSNRRCLCELATQIGFVDGCTDGYTVEKPLAVFRNLGADMVRRETRFARSLQLSTKVKVPLPHMLAVAVRDPANQLQMFSQGTADIILDSCLDYWNGRDLTPLTAADRKKILDFYQRNSLTAYCTAFAYKPLSRGIADSLSRLYLELPADSRRLYPAPRWPDPTATNFHSTDSLLFNEATIDDIADADGYYELQCDQVFIGMVTMQYQAQSDVVSLVERLERACIRFVHFSKENELRSRVFSEKLGLESGWNCHISLVDGQQHSKCASPFSSQTIQSGVRQPAGASCCGNNQNMSFCRALSVSAPGAINLESTTVRFDNEIKKTRHSITAHSGYKAWQASEEVSAGAEGDTHECSSPPEACQSLSCLTDSTDHSAPVNFDCSNRAKLPRGIENIRPHIEQVDSVPLLVSLFTDCTPRSVCQMIQIMQDYEEVVCVMGSAANNLNIDIFMQADASIAIEPLYPVLCQKMPPYSIPDDCISPIHLARALTSLPCSLSVNRESELALFGLIAWSRHHAACLASVAQYCATSACYLTFLQMASLWCGAPLVLAFGGAAWAACTACVTGAALALPPPDPAVMQRAAPARNPKLTPKMALFVFWCYACKFLPSAIFIVALYTLTLRDLCARLASADDAYSCSFVYPVAWGTAGWEGDRRGGLETARIAALTLTIVHLVVISISFVHRQHSVWQRKFWTNRVWTCTVLLFLLLQCVYVAFAVGLRRSDCEQGACFSYSASWPLVASYVVSPLAVFLINELIKWQEIKLDQRIQRRARLDFGTKLGMNSPWL